MVESKRALVWLARAIIATRIWQAFGEVRGVYCTHFRPMDGIEADALDTPGYTPAELETRAIEAHCQTKQLEAPSPENPETERTLADLRRRMEGKLKSKLRSAGPRFYENQPLNAQGP
jgi:hypothetical protein